MTDTITPAQTVTPARTITPAPATDTHATFRGLDQAMLERFRERAPSRDTTGTYPTEDLAELVAAGWLLAPLPVELGGLGLDLATVVAEQRRLARFAPATALSTSMHLYWAGTAADLHRFGHPFAERLLGWIVDGDVMASGHAEAGNDVPIALSTTRAERVPGGWRLHGRKQFGSLGPVWDRIGFHAMDPTSSDGPVVVHGFVARHAPGVTVEHTWDAQGMRATESHDTVFDGAFVPDADVMAVVPAGTTDDPSIGVMTVWALTLISNVYVGIAERAMELAIADARRKTSIGLPAGPMAHHPYVQRDVASMHLELTAARAVVDRLAGDWVGGVDHGAGWPVEIFSAKWRAAGAALRVVDLACEVVGGASFRRGGELERLSRDVRGARFHPANDAFTHEVVGKALLGVQPGPARW